ncbi:C-terminal domain of 1-Cys peroxiredoxin [Globodera pallida]|nr:C-terminal domain of 1-Cys peroxiredoxin [Globodera pallida]
MLLGEQFPDFAADTSNGKLDSFHQWMGADSWAVLFSHPADFTPVCTTELARAAQLATEFAQRRVKMIALSCDTAETHRQWTEDIAAYANRNVSAVGEGGAPRIKPGADFPFPIIADNERVLATKFGMVDPLNDDAAGVPLTVRAVFIVDPKKRLRLSILYPASTGRNFDEILRVIDSLQLSDNFMVATPEGWKSGSACMVEPRVSDAKAVEMFGGTRGGVGRTELPSGKGYLRTVDDPRGNVPQ